MNEQELIQKRLLDLSNQAERKGIVIFSDFLNLNELNIYHRIRQNLACKTECFGGVPYAERQIVAFLPDALYYDWNYPIASMQLVPSYPKFAEKLGHRDILGSLMNLGVDRSKIGDILLSEDRYYLFCEESIADYFIDNLTTVRHTQVHLVPVSPEQITSQQHLIEKSGTVASNRLDALLACVYPISRKDALGLLASEKIFVNDALIQNPSHSCHPGDIISVRGYGRFVFAEESGATNKGRLRIRYQLYPST